MSESSVQIPEDGIVFDTEPLVAHAMDEPGAEVVDEYLNAVYDNVCAGFCSVVNLAELRYILARESDTEQADEQIEWHLNSGIRRVDALDRWRRASDFVLNHNPALGDSFALATASSLDVPLLAGGDSEFDEITDVDVIRFREFGV